MMQQSPTPRLKPQGQDNPSASIGRYGMYRALLNASTPRLQVSPVSQSLDAKQKPVRFRRGGGPVA
jgi:hypothetical protein